MELRKVQLTGGSSLTVTLPKAWAERSRLHAGDVVGFTEQVDGSLTMLAHMKGERPKTEYAIPIESEGGDYLLRKIIAAYLMGFDAVRITSKQPFTSETRRTIRAAVRKIIGLEIVEEQPTSLVIQDFLDPREFHMERSLRRMGLLTQAMQGEAFSALRTPRADSEASAEDRDDEVDRLFWLINKQYHAMLRDAQYGAKMGLSPSQALNFLLCARLVERTADHADRIASQTVFLVDQKVTGTLVAKLEKQGRRAAELFQQALQHFFRKDARKANEIILETERFLATQERLLQEATALGSELVSHLAIIIESIGRTAAYASDVAEVAINHKVASES